MILIKPAGEFQIGDNIKPLDPKSVASVVQYGRLSFLLNKRAKGNSLIYNQLYPFEGLKNYTSGIIHHVKLTGKSTSNATSYLSCFRLITISIYNAMMWLGKIIARQNSVIT